MGMRKPRDLPERLHHIGDEFARHPLASIVAFTVLGLFIVVPFLFLLYPAWLFLEHLRSERWPETPAVLTVVLLTAFAYLIIWFSSIGRISYLLALSGTLSYLVFNETFGEYGAFFSSLSCAAVMVVGATVILLTQGLRE